MGKEMGWLQQEFQSKSSVWLLVIIIGVVLIFVGILCFSWASYIPGVKQLQQFCFSCVKETSSPTVRNVLASWRGNNYFLDVNDPEKAKQHQPGKCALTGWGATHILTYMALGFVVPKLFLTVFMIALIWELIESLHNCHDALDLILNLTGFVIGAALRLVYDRIVT
jgi:hypothetical protein